MKLLKLGLAALSLLCILDMPYGYYQLYRFLALGVFLYLAYEEQDQKEWMIVWLMSALLVQPIFKIALGREIWNLVDIAFALILIISAFKKEPS
jgi:RsiW-degrading membrane proteinase PrsW (M82 family)